MLFDHILIINSTPQILLTSSHHFPLINKKHNVSWKWNRAWKLESFCWQGKGNKLSSNLSHGLKVKQGGRGGVGGVIHTEISTRQSFSTHWQPRNIGIAVLTRLDVKLHQQSLTLSYTHQSTVGRQRRNQRGGERVPELSQDLLCWQILPLKSPPDRLHHNALVIPIHGEKHGVHERNTPPFTARAFSIRLRLESKCVRLISRHTHTCGENVSVTDLTRRLH